MTEVPNVCPVCGYSPTKRELDESAGTCPDCGYDPKDWQFVKPHQITDVRGGSA